MSPRRVLVTGGAKRLGATIVRAAAAAGHQPVIHYGGSAAEAEALAAELGSVAVQGDLADLAALPGMFARAAEAAGGVIDGLVNSASTFLYDRPEAIDHQLALRLHAINALAPSILAQALAAQPGLTDGAVAGATEMLALALAPRVRVNAISPGLTLPSGGQSEAEFARVASANLLQRPVGAEEIARAAVYLLEARSVTGQNLFVDCGQRFVKSDCDVMFDGDAGRPDA